MSGALHPRFSFSLYGDEHMLCSSLILRAYHAHAYRFFEAVQPFVSGAPHPTSRIFILYSDVYSTCYGGCCTRQAFYARVTRRACLFSLGSARLELSGGVHFHFQNHFIGSEVSTHQSIIANYFGLIMIVGHMHLPGVFCGLRPLENSLSFSPARERALLQALLLEQHIFNHLYSVHCTYCSKLYVRKLNFYQIF